MAQKIPQKNFDLVSSDEDSKAYQTELNPTAKKLANFHRYHQPPSKTKKVALAQHNDRIDKLTALKKKTLQYANMAVMMADTQKQQLLRDLSMAPNPDSPRMFNKS